MTLAERVLLAGKVVSEFIDDPKKIAELPTEEQLDILGAIQHYFELNQALVRRTETEHSSAFMEAHADVNYWKNKLLNAKARLRLEITNRERGL